MMELDPIKLRELEKHSLDVEDVSEDLHLADTGALGLPAIDHLHDLLGLHMVNHIWLKEVLFDSVIDFPHALYAE